MKNSTTTMLCLIGMATSTKLLQEKTENQKCKHAYLNHQCDFTKPQCGFANQHR